MTSEPQNADAKAEALQAVIDRVSSYEETATAQTIRAELVEALGQAGIELDTDTVDRLVADISGDDPAGISARNYL